MISACNTFKANKATGPDNTPAWVLRNHANVLAPPVTAISNNSLREGVLPMEWKMANVISLQQQPQQPQNPQYQSDESRKYKGKQLLKVTIHYASAHSAEVA